MKKHSPKDQLFRVKLALYKHGWKTLATLSEKTKAPEASVSARLRDLRKVRYGNWEVLKRRLDDGRYEYRLGHCFMEPPEPVKNTILESLHAFIDCAMASLEEVYSLKVPQGPIQQDHIDTFAVELADVEASLKDALRVVRRLDFKVPS